MSLLESNENREKAKNMKGKKLLMFQIRVKNCLKQCVMPSVTVFFFGKRKNLGQLDDAKQRKKKGMAL